MRTAAATLMLSLASFASFAAAGWPDSYGETQMQWSYDKPEGGEITLNGTIEQANAEFEALYPGVLAASQTRPELVARQDDEPLPPPPKPTGWFAELKAPPECFPAGGNAQGWERASLEHLSEGWGYLFDVEGRPRAGPGLGDCARVSCSYDAAIYWCNDNDHDVELKSFEEIAVAAADLCYGCTGGFAFPSCGGQLFSKKGVNVIVRADSC